MPSHHSSSSHSSSSHSSSSHSSSSHSSSSHSSSSHSSSSHSSSSHSGGSYSSSSYSSSSSSSRSYSGSSSSRRAAEGMVRRLEKQTSRYVTDGSMKGSVIRRSRRSQPTGYSSSKRPPTEHYCQKHNYVYYPEDWTGLGGRSFQKGYYDENGEFYETVVFKKDGVYQKVLCKCDYCGASVVRNLKEETELSCPKCGAPLRIDVMLDEYTQDPAYTSHRQIYQEACASVRKEKWRTWRWALVPLVIFVFLFSLGRSVSNSSTREIPVSAALSEEAPAASGPSNPDIFGQTIYLKRTDDNCYVISSEAAADYDKKLSWDYGEDSYYDREADCWLWYNTEVSPNLWQYWYEGISSDFGDFGWMEYEPDGWYIETDEGVWVPLPEKYDSSALWHFEIDPRDYMG